MGVLAHAGGMNTLKKRCGQCGRWYTPDPRVRGRQRCCDDPKCRRQLRQKTQRSWRERNASYFSERRLRAKAERNAERAKAVSAEPSKRPPPSRSPPSELKQIPWDYVREVFGVEGETLLAYLLGLVLRAAKDGRGIEHAGNKEELSLEARPVKAGQAPCQDETLIQVGEKTGEMGTLGHRILANLEGAQDETLN